MSEEFDFTKYRQHSHDFVNQIMKIFGLKVGDMVQSISINLSVGQHPRVEIVKVLNKEEMEEIVYLVQKETSVMKEVPVAEPTHHYEFKHKDALPEEELKVKPGTNIDEIFIPVEKSNE